MSERSSFAPRARQSTKPDPATLTPRFWTERTYVPNVVAEQVPVTRQVAVRGTQTINYQVAKMVPVTTTRKVAVNTVKN